MSDELPEDDPRRVWQGQRTEASPMALRLIQSKARELQTRTRRKLLGMMAGPLAAAFLYAFGIREFASQGQVLHPLFATALVWSLIGLYFLTRGMRRIMMPSDAGLSTGLAFCRGELERQRDLLRRVLLWSLGPMLLALASFILGLAMIGPNDRGLFPNGLPFLALVILWIAGYFALRERELRQLKREIEELNELERDDQA